MKIVNIIGGLGNQMFQYAFALTLKEHYKNEAIFIDTIHFKNYNLHNGFELDKIFNLQLDQASRKQLKVVTRPIKNYKISRVLRKFLPNMKTEYIEKEAYAFDENVFQLHGNKYFEGYWQSPLFYTGIENIIRNEFIFKNLTDNYNSNILNMINNSQSISIHIRRGDYVKAENYQGICNLEYYRNAIKYVLANIVNPKFFLFSNDIVWCKENIVPLLNNKDCVIIDKNSGVNSYMDMQLMSHCKVNIIANSSFSWWGAWLNRSTGHIVLAPSRWVNFSQAKDIYPTNWIKINN